MKINFTKLQTATGSIKVSLDGGQSFTEYNLEDLYESGISLSDDQDYEKIQIQAPANVLKNLNVVSSVKVEADLSEYIQKEYFQGEFYDGSCGYGYRIASWPYGFNRNNADILYNLYLENGITLGELCEYNGDSMFIPSSEEEPPTGQLYIKLSYNDGCPGSYKYVPTLYFLK